MQAAGRAGAEDMASSAHINQILALYILVSKRCSVSSPWSAVTPAGRSCVTQSIPVRVVWPMLLVQHVYIIASAIRIKPGLSLPQKSLLMEELTGLPPWPQHPAPLRGQIPGADPTSVKRKLELISQAARQCPSEVGVPRFNHLNPAQTQRVP